MNSKRLFLWLTFAVFAFAFVPALVVGSPSRNSHIYSDNLITSFFGLENIDSCEYPLFWSIPLEMEVSFLYYTKEYPEGKFFNFDLQPVPDILFTTQTKILTHGFRASVNSHELRPIIAAYLQGTEELNILALDWSYYSNRNYPEAAKSTITVGKAISSLFCLLYKYYDIYPHQMHFIGHGLGAHLFAATARESRTRVGRITGLDPARLCFEKQCQNKFYPQLCKNDAEFVDILHTDAKTYGIRSPQGTVDFYANRGRNQPMCHAPYALKPVSDFCESTAACLYFAESILIPKAFYGIHCESIHPILKCNKSIGAFWGEHMDTIAVGMYNFRTRGKAYFGEGVNEEFRSDFKVLH